jgi:ATP-binding cassette subfamily F protein uup
VLDEPTNDLDVETLEVLEERLAEYSGTLLVVSHDREFLDNVVTRILVFEAGGGIVEYAGGYSEWARRGRELALMDAPVAARASERAAAPEPSAPREPAPARKPPRKAKLGYLEQRELDGLPAMIEALEAEIAALERSIAAPDFYAQAWEQTQPVLDRLSAKHAEHDRLAERWLELEERRDALAAGQPR